MPKNQIKTLLIIILLVGASWVLPAHAADWIAQNSGTTSAINSIDMYDFGTGYAVGDNGVILKTTNGGQGWASQTSPVNVNWKDVEVVNASVAWIVGENGLMAKTENGGATWTSLAKVVTSNLNAIEFLSSETGFIVGDSGTILYTFDSGATWTKKTDLTTQNLFDIHGGTYLGGLSLKRAFAVGANGTIVRFDTMGGWTVLSSGTTNVLQDVYVKQGTESLEVWVAADGVGAGGAPGFLKTTNKGSSWTTISQSAVTSGSITSVAMNSSGVGFATTSTGKTLKTTDGGTSWVADKNFGSSIYLNEVSIQGSGDTFAAWAVGKSGKIYRYDGTSPSAVSSITQTSDVKDNTPTFTWTTSTDDTQGTYGTGIHYYAISLDGGEVIATTQDLTVTLTEVVADGTHTLSIYVVDKAGNESESISKTFTIDTSVATDTNAPTGTISINSDASATNSVSVTLTTTCTDNVACTRMQISVDGTLDTESFESYATTKSITLPSGDGNKYIKIKFKDAAENISPQYTTSIILDTTAQETSIVQKPSSSTSDSSAVFTFDYSGTSITSVLFECRLDTSVFSSCVSPKTYSGLSSDSHTFYVRSVDAAGNYDATPASYSWTITGTSADTSSPTVPQNLKKISSDADSTPTFAWNASTDNTGVTSYLIQVNDGSLVDIGGNLTYTASTLANGSHTIKVLAKDAAGNTSPTSTLYFSVDTTLTPTTVECSLTIGSAYKLTTSPAVYYITEDCTKRPFTNPNIFFSYFDSWSDVVTISKSSLDEVWNDPLGFMPWGPKYDPKYGALVKIVSDPKVYLLLGTEKYWITSETIFLGLNYSWSWVEDVDKALLNKYTTGSEIDYTDHHPNYTIVKYATSPKVYRLEPDPSNSNKQVKRHVLNETVFNSLNFRWDRIVTIPSTEVYTDGAVIE